MLLAVLHGMIWLAKYWAVDEETVWLHRIVVEKRRGSVGAAPQFFV